MSDVYATRSAYDAGLVVNAPTMNKTEVNGYLQDRTLATMFPPVCMKSHWEPEALSSKYILPGDLHIPLPVDPRPLVKNCTTYVTTTPASVYPKEEAIARSRVGLSVQPGGSASRGVPFEVYAENVNAESDIFLNHPQDKCDDNKFIAAPDSDLYTNRHAPPARAPDRFLELARPLATIVPKGPYNCRTEVDNSAWARSSRLFNNPTREDRIPGAAARNSEALLSTRALRTAKPAVVPRVWPTKSIVFYSEQNVNSALIQLSLALKSRDWEVTIFTPNPNQMIEGLSFHRVDEFVPNDIYSCLVLWGTSDLLANFQHRPEARALLLNLEDADDKEAVCARPVQELVDKIVVKSAFHRSLYCYRWSKFEVVPDGLPAPLFLENRALPRERGRVLVTEYSMALVNFVNQGWKRIVSTYPQAEMHVWSTKGDEKEKVSQILAPVARSLGITLNGETDVNGLVRERFMSNVHLCFSDSDLVSCEPARMSVLAGCIPIMPSRGVYLEIPGVNVSGNLGVESTMIEYAKAVSALFKDPEAANVMRHRNQLDAGLKGWHSTADRWIAILEGLRESKKPFSQAKFNGLFN
jgi:hypothetical protein